MAGNRDKPKPGSDVDTRWNYTRTKPPNRTTDDNIRNTFKTESLSTSGIANSPTSFWDMPEKKYKRNIRTILNINTPSTSTTTTTVASSPLKGTDTAIELTAPGSFGALKSCAVCCDDIVYYAVGQCNHRVICYMCSLHMRALSKNKYCVMCRTDLDIVVFTRNETTLFERMIASKNIFNESLQIFCDTVPLLMKVLSLFSFQCQVCAKRYDTMDLLKDHLLKAHDKCLCDLCLDHLKIFLFEFSLYSPKELIVHNVSGDPSNTSHRGHPQCEFCLIRYFDNDHLFYHLRDKHFKCHVCATTGDINSWWCDYQELEQHFKEAHKPCNHEECRVKKFIVFANDAELRAHIASEHTKNMGRSAKRQAMQQILRSELGFTSYESRGTSSSRNMHASTLSTSANSTVSMTHSVSDSQLSSLDFPSLSSVVSSTNYAARPTKNTTRSAISRGDNVRPGYLEISLSAGNSRAPPRASPTPLTNVMNSKPTGSQKQSPATVSVVKKENIVCSPRSSIPSINKTPEHVTTSTPAPVVSSAHSPAAIVGESVSDITSTPSTNQTLKCTSISTPTSVVSSTTAVVPESVSDVTGAPSINTTSTNETSKTASISTPAPVVSSTTSLAAVAAGESVSDLTDTPSTKETLKHESISKSAAVASSIPSPTGIIVAESVWDITKTASINRTPKPESTSKPTPVVSSTTTSPTAVTIAESVSDITNVPSTNQTQNRVCLSTSALVVSSPTLSTATTTESVSDTTSTIFAIETPKRTSIFKPILDISCTTTSPATPIVVKSVSDVIKPTSTKQTSKPSSIFTPASVLLSTLSPNASVFPMKIVDANNTLSKTTGLEWDGSNKTISHIKETPKSIGDTKTLLVDTSQTLTSQHIANEIPLSVVVNGGNEKDKIDKETLESKIDNSKCLSQGLNQLRHNEIDAETFYKQYVCSNEDVMNDINFEDFLDLIPRDKKKEIEQAHEQTILNNLLISIVKTKWMIDTKRFDIFNQVSHQFRLNKMDAIDYYVFFFRLFGPTSYLMFEDFLSEFFNKEKQLILDKIHENAIKIQCSVAMQVYQ